MFWAVTSVKIHQYAETATLSLALPECVMVENCWRLCPEEPAAIVTVGGVTSAMTIVKLAESRLPPASTTSRLITWFPGVANVNVRLDPERFCAPPAVKVQKSRRPGGYVPDAKFGSLSVIAVDEKLTEVSSFAFVGTEPEPVGAVMSRIVIVKVAVYMLPVMSITVRVTT